LARTFESGWLALEAAESVVSMKLRYWFLENSSEVEVDYIIYPEFPRGDSDDEATLTVRGLRAEI
jgi:hypothetical protein